MEGTVGDGQERGCLMLPFPALGLHDWTLGCGLLPFHVATPLKPGPSASYLCCTCLHACLPATLLFYHAHYLLHLTRTRYV